MQTVKFSGEILTEAVEAARLLKQSNSVIAAATKAVEASKEKLIALLKQNRGIEVESLPIGAMIQIDGVLLLEIGKQNKFAEKEFMLTNPSEYQAFKKDFPVRKFKSLVV